MDFINSTNHAIQLLLALSISLALLVLAYAGHYRTLFIGIVVMIPFQPIDSQYGSINMAVTYVVAFAMLFNSFRSKPANQINTPLIVPFVLLFMAFFISWSMSPTLFWPKYMVYLIKIGSNVALFYMSYAYFRKEKDLEIFFKALIFSNVLVVIYSVAQIFVGYGHFSLFGVNELSFIENRHDQRLVGPFLAVGVTAEYLVIQSLMLVHYMVQSGRMRRFGMLLLLFNLAILVGTGNRGGLLSALLAVLLFLYFYKRYIGVRGVLLAAFGFLIMLIGSSYVMIKYTDFNVLYERLIDTKVDGITPESRIGWGYVIEKIAEQPVIGHGPEIVQPGDYIYPPRNWPKGYLDFYPHSLYLFILYTTGFVGFLAYAVWATTYWKILCQARKRSKTVKGLGAGLSTLGMMVFVIFLFDQFKVEFLRGVLLDYQHYLAVLFGMFAAAGNVRYKDEPQNKGVLIGAGKSGIS